MTTIFEKYFFIGLNFGNMEQYLFKQKSILKTLTIFTARIQKRAVNFKYIYPIL